MTGNAEQPHTNAERSPKRVPLLDRVLFYVLLAVFCARLLISESFERVSLFFLPAAAEIGTTPATTIWLDGILLSAALLVWVFRWRPRPRPSVFLVGLALLLIGVVVSTMAADDKHLAATGGTHLLVVVLAGTALVRVMRTRWMVCTLLAATLAGGVTNSVKCISQRTGEFDESLEYWQQQKAELAERGANLDSPTVVNYERRLRSGNATGYLSHPNVTASCLAMCLLLSVGIIGGVVGKPHLSANERAAAVLLAGVLLVLLTTGLYLTGSLGAAAAAALGGITLFGLILTRRWVVRHTRSAFIALALGYVAVIAAGAGYGLLKGTLPHTSLAFRWEYWQAATRALSDASLTGLGRENFAAKYLLYKSAASTEEVRNAHNLWLTLLLELGVGGLLAGLCLVGAAVYTSIRACAYQYRPSPATRSPGRLAAAAIGVLAVVALFAGEPFGNPGVLLLWLVFVAGVWLLAFLAAYILIAQVGEHSVATTWLAAALVAGLCAALVHNLIGISLFTPAGLSLFAVLAAAAYASRSPSRVATHASAFQEPCPRPGSWFSGLCGSVVLCGYIAFVAYPNLSAEHRFSRLKADLRSASNYAERYQVLKRGLDALQHTPLLGRDASIPLWAAETAVQVATTADLSDEARRRWFSLADEYACCADRWVKGSFAVKRLRAAVIQHWAGWTGELSLLRKAEQLWEAEVIPRYPTNPRSRIAAGRVQFELWKRTGDAQFAVRATKNYRAALAIDATRPPEVAVKLRPSELGVVSERLDELRAAGFDIEDG